MKKIQSDREKLLGRVRFTLSRLQAEQYKPAQLAKREREARIDEVNRYSRAMLTHSKPRLYRDERIAQLSPPKVSDGEEESHE